MFGLQFTVSAGRCTRGAFMQLVRVSEEVRAQLQYDFVLVVDTEGLRSPELSNKTSLSHDNELATLIIGIGDMTLINIMGENPSEMQDILQICVQAFLRMTSVQIKPSCIFVHQNVAEASANEKNMEGRRCLLEKLDEMARIAATEEKHEVTGFSDIIQFDVESQVFYFKNLLEGDPLMAPPNPSYSQNVQELKMKLLSVAQWQPRVKFPSLSEFKLRIRDVWNALLGENFVFSFRNTLEMLVYSKLEQKYGEWSWKMRKRALEIQNRLSNQINNNIVQAVTLSDLMRKFNGVYSTLTAEIEKYFKEEKKQEILINWKVNVDKRFEILRNELTEETRKQSNELIRLKKCRLELDRKKSEYESELIKMSKDLASRLKEQKLSDKKVEEQFDRLWKSWVTRVSSELPPEDIRATVQNILLEKFKNQGDVLNKIVNREEMFQFNKKKHIKQSWARSVWNTVTSQDPQCEFHGNELTQHIQRAVNKYIDRREGEKVDFNENFIHEILGLIKSNITDYEKSTEQNIFTKEYKFELSVYLCFTAAPQFEKLHTAFRRANDPLIYLESKRDQYLDSFKSFCKGATSVTFFVDFLCRCLKPAIQQAVCAKTCIQITDDMKSNCPAFSGNRSNLENHILRHLAEQEDFDSYMEYINQPKDYFERFIRERVERYCRNNSDQLRVMFNTNLTDLVQQVITVNTTVTAAVRERHGGATLWLDDFCVALSDHMELPRQDFRNIENEDITDLKFLRETMARSLEEILENLQKESSSKPDLDLKMFRLRPDEILCEALSGCWEQCPFCKSICTNTIPGHETDHSVQFHRSKALAGWHRRGTDEFC
ncbi:interferon-induced very large GTPase 1-like [Lepisosteus oculatus]|uniref:interferon-induced very large GTPase 1-like n=1 Tax=Lepisosteus oculatus TaxID=7918 RepID=UPI0035F529FE